MARKVFAVDIHSDRIEVYKTWHRAGGPPASVTAAIRDDGVTELEIYLVGDRLVLIMEVDDAFDAEAKAARDAANPDIQAWDALMRTCQKPLPFGPEGSTWLQMERIYSLQEPP